MQDRIAGRPETPRQRGGVRTEVPGSVLLVVEPRHDTVEKPLSLVAQRLSPDKFSFWIDECHVFSIRSLNGRPPAFGVPLGKDLVQIAVKQIVGVRHGMSPLS